MTQPKKKAGNRRGTGPANRFSQLLNAELRAEVARQRISLRMLEEMTGISRARLSITINQDASPLTTNELDQICEALNINLVDIFQIAEAACKKETEL